MVAPSKLFEPPLAYLHCSQGILHPGMGCLHSFLHDVAKNFFGGLKYFSPLLLMPLVLKFKTMDRQMFEATVKYYLSSVLWTTMASSSAFFLLCCISLKLWHLHDFLYFLFTIPPPDELLDTPLLSTIGGQAVFVLMTLTFLCVAELRIDFVCQLVYYTYISYIMSNYLRVLRWTLRDDRNPFEKTTDEHLMELYRFPKPLCMELIAKLIPFFPNTRRKYAIQCHTIVLSALRLFLPLVASNEVLDKTVYLLYPKVDVCGFYTYTTLFIPTVMGMQFCWMFPEKLLKLCTTATSQAVLEGLLRQYKNFFTRSILHSTPLKTFIFMINSAIILHYKRLKVYRDFWLMQPYDTDRKDTDVNANKIYRKSNCVHAKEVSCRKFVLTGMKAYLHYGIALDLLNTILRKKVGNRSSGVFCKTWSKITAFRPIMTGFFIFYSGIYRLSSCLLRKYYGHLPEDLQHVLAAFLGGSSYLLIDNFSFLTLSTVIAVQILWQSFCLHLNGKEEESDLKNPTTSTARRKPNLALMLLKDVPFSRIVFSLNMGYLVHNFVLNYDILNSLTRGFLDGLSSNKTKHIQEAITKQTMGELIHLSTVNPVRYFF